MRRIAGPGAVAAGIERRPGGTVPKNSQAPFRDDPTRASAHHALSHLFPAKDDDSIVSPTHGSLGPALTDVLGPNPLGSPRTPDVTFGPGRQVAERASCGAPVFASGADRVFMADVAADHQPAAARRARGGGEVRKSMLDPERMRTSRPDWLVL